MPEITICANPNSQNDCCDIRVTGILVVDDVVHLREEVAKAGFTVINPVRESQDTIVWTLQRPYGELVSDIHLQQLAQAAKVVGMEILQ
jgi:hypothetical protein